MSEQSPDERRRKFLSAKSKAKEEQEPLLASSHLSGFDSFSLVIILWQLAMMGIFFGFSSYSTTPSSTAASLYLYSYYRDVAVMVFVGFGFLTAFLRRHRFGSLTFVLLLSVLAVQWGMIVNGFFLNYLGQGSNSHQGWLVLDMTAGLNALFSAAALLISFGVWIGKVGGEILLLLGILEIILQGLNNYIVTFLIGTSDIGGTIVIHAFGAYFGLAATIFVSPKDTAERAEFASSEYASDTFSLLATFFLLIFWPSFNGATAPTAQQVPAILNTVLALAASSLTALAASRLFRWSRKWTLEDIQNSTLAGGVSMGSSAALLNSPGGAVLLGILAGALSVLGYAKIGPFLQQRFGVYDTAGVNNLHGMPALLGGVASCVVVAARASEFSRATPPVFASLQIAGLGCTLGISILGGLVCGLLVKILPLRRPHHLFNDSDAFHVSVLCNHAPRCGHAECGGHQRVDPRTTLANLSHFLHEAEGHSLNP